MPFSLKATTHVFTKTAEGGTQRVIAKSPADAQQVRLVREHLQDIQAEFLKGDFSGPSHIHGIEMPGLAAHCSGPGQGCGRQRPERKGLEVDHRPRRSAASAVEGRCRARPGLLDLGDVFGNGWPVARRRRVAE